MKILSVGADLFYENIEMGQRRTDIQYETDASSLQFCERAY
jgi:hypothetical protein